MKPLRHLLLRYPAFAPLLIVAALLMKVAVPAGFMPMVSGGSVTIQLCSGFGVESMAMPGMADHRGRYDHSGKAEMPCGFAGHAPASLLAGSLPPVAVAIASLIAALFFRKSNAPLQRVGRLRPRLRDPPKAS